MTLGLHSTIHILQTRLYLRWCPKWYGAFSDPLGGFYERLGKGFKPVYTGQRRLVTQCRQLSIYSHALFHSNNKLYKNLKVQFEYILDRYRDPKTGLWHFSLDDEGQVKDKTCDLYALTFVIFSFSHYYRATGDVRAKDHALGVLDLIDTKFRLKVGLAEAIDSRFQPIPQMRRQNPHMHLLEACLFAHAVWGDPKFEAMADEMVALFYDKFFDPAHEKLTEFFEEDLSPHSEKGEVLEPGHYFEWVWLLKKHAVMKNEPERHDAAAMILMNFANRHGWDETYGGIYDEVSQTGQVISNTKRIWPFCEGLKANALMLTGSNDRQAVKDRVSAMVTLFHGKYMQERGFWVERLNRDLTHATDYMPGTTPYHVYFGITETMEILKARGAGKSWRAKVQTGLYTARRFFSRGVRFLTTKFAK
jgi:mannose/cellobiose epimerase-like protein (N-acyl-D-glucosamine 2-epimerase family)